MVWNRDNYYMLCFSNGHDDMVTYRLDKMENVKVEEAEREPHPEYELFNTEEYRQQVFSMFGGETKKVTLLFTVWVLRGNTKAVVQIKGATIVTVAYPCRLKTEFEFKDETLTVNFAESDSARLFEIVF